MWFHAKPDPNGLQADPSFHDVHALPLTTTRGTSAYDPYNRSTVAPGVVRQRTVHIGLEAHTALMNEGPSSTLLPYGISDYVNDPAYYGNLCTCAPHDVGPTGLPLFVLTPTIANGTHYWALQLAFPAGDNVVSFYVKANGYTAVGLGLYDGNASVYMQGYVDLTTGLDTHVGDLVMGSEDVGGGWYRIWSSMTWTAGASNMSNFTITIFQTGTNLADFAGDGTSGILVSQPSAEPGLTKPTSWISSRNICFHSSDMSNGAAWGINGGTVTGNQAVDPISGLLTAALFSEDNTNGIHQLNKGGSGLPAGMMICTSVYFKPIGRTWFLLNNDAGASGCWFDCSGAGSVGSFNGGGDDAGIDQLSGSFAGWYRCWYTSIAGGSNSIDIYLATGDTVYSYQGTSTPGGYICNLQVEHIGLATTAYPDPLNIVQSAGNLANMTHWGSGAIVGVASGVTDPFGGTAAFTLTNTGGGTSDALQQALTGLPSGGPVLFSIYLRYGNTTQTSFSLYDSTASQLRGSITITWASGQATLLSVSGGMASLGLFYAGNGWYRIMTRTASGIIPGNTNTLYVYPSTTGAGAAGQFVYACAPQITSLIPTVYWGVNGTLGGRDAEVISASLSSITDTRLNLAAYSEQLDNSVWQLHSPSGTVTANNATDPNGNMYAETVTFTGSGNDFLYSQNASVSAIVGQRYTFILWVKGGTKATANIRMVNSANSADAVASRVTLTGSWQRVVITHTFTVTGTSIDYGIDNRAGQGGDGLAGTVLAFGAQLVHGVDPGATGYTPTHATPVVATQAGLSTTDGSMIALGIPYTGYQGSANYYSHIGSTDFIMDPSGSGQMSRAVNAGASTTQVVDQLNIAILTWSTAVDKVIFYFAGLALNSASIGQTNCPLPAGDVTIPIGCQAGGTNNYEGWVWLGYVHNRAYTPAECIAFAGAITNG